MATNLEKISVLPPISEMTVHFGGLELFRFDSIREGGCINLWNLVAYQTSYSRADSKTLGIIFVYNEAFEH